MKLKQILTTGEIADYCGVDFRTVIRWIDNNRLKGYRLPARGDRRVKIADFIYFLKENNLPLPDRYRDRALRVLIVEDEKDLALIMHGVLQKAGYEVRIANDGFNAGQLLESFYPDVMTLDLRMPGINGIQVLKRVKIREKFAHLKVLIVSGVIESELEEALREGADEVLKKPFENVTLLKKIANLRNKNITEKINCKIVN